MGSGVVSVDDEETDSESESFFFFDLLLLEMTISERRLACFSKSVLGSGFKWFLMYMIVNGSTTNVPGCLQIVSLPLQKAYL